MIMSAWACAHRGLAGRGGLVCQVVTGRAGAAALALCSFLGSDFTGGKVRV